MSWSLTIKGFEREFAQFQKDKRADIDALETRIAAKLGAAGHPSFDDVHWDLIADLKNLLCAGEAASRVTDAGQCRAMDRADQWVTDNVSNTTGATITVALGLFLYDEEQLVDLVEEHCGVAV